MTYALSLTLIIFFITLSVVKAQEKSQEHSFDQSGTGPRPVKIVLVGDSTMCQYPQERVDRGWGQFIEEYFREGTVRIENLACPGRSTKTFIQEGRWEKALGLNPDFVLIQFGHNDSHAPDKPESTDARSDYKEYLRRYVQETRQIGAIPVLITPMVRRDFDAAGKIREDQIVGNLAAYAQAMRQVSQETGTVLIDLYTSSKTLAEKLGPQQSANYANRKGDITHFNEIGARAMAELVMQDLEQSVAELKPLLKTQRP